MNNRCPERKPLLSNASCDDALARLQDTLDGILPWEVAEELSRPHRENCSLCRERWAAARLLLKALRCSPVDSPRGSRTRSVTQIVSQVQADQHRRRLRGGLLTAALGLAAALFIAVTLWNSFNRDPTDPPVSSLHTRQTEPEHSSKPAPQTPMEPLRLNATLTRVADTVWESIPDWAEPAWPRWPDNPLATSQPEPPAWGELLLSSVRTGFEPVKDTTQKALDCFLRDLATWQPQTPKS